MKRYALVSTPDKQQFCGSIDKAMSEEWELIGGVSAAAVPGPLGGVQILYSQGLWKDMPLIQVKGD